MRLIQYLTDEYVTSFKHYGNYVEIFKNPSRKEMLDASSTQGVTLSAPGKNIRFFVDMKNHDLYVWSPNSYHADAANAIAKDNGGFSGNKFNYQMAIPGVATLQGGKWNMTSSDELDSDYAFDEYFNEFGDPTIGNKIKSYDFSDFKWVKSRINVEPFFKGLDFTG